MPWIIGGAILGSSLLGSMSASDASDQQAQATGQAAQVSGDAQKYAADKTLEGQNLSVAELARQYDLTRGDLLGTNERARSDLLANQAKGEAVTQPYIDAGTGALSNTVAGVGDGTNGSLTRRFSISDFWNDPVVQASYQTGLDLGTKALKNAAPLTTGLDSGAALKELTKFGTDYTGGMAAGSQARFSADQGNQYNRLLGLIGVGQNAVGQRLGVGSATVGGLTTSGSNTAGALAGAGSGTASGISGAYTGGANTLSNIAMNGGNTIAGLYSNLGNARAASTIAQGNAFGSGLSSVANFWNQNQMMNRMYPQSTSAANPSVALPSNYGGGMW
jgi:hypothetical protein